MYRKWIWCKWDPYILGSTLQNTIDFGYYPAEQSFDDFILKTIGFGHRGMSYLLPKGVGSGTFL